MIAPNLVASVVGDTIPAGARLRVYRHHVFHSLATALSATFPTVHALVGDEFFRGLTRAFVASTLPKNPVLSEYGAGFAPSSKVTRRQEDCRIWPTSQRLDWALNAGLPQPGRAATRCRRSRDDPGRAAAW